MLAGFIANVVLLGVSGAGLADWRWMLLAGVLAPLSCLIGLSLGFIPESPRSPGALRAFTIFLFT